MTPPFGRGFYGVVDAPASPEAAVALALALVAGGACAVQVRMKRASTRDLVAVCRAVREAVRTVPFVVNDRLDVALLVGADGVHLGQDDLALADARAVLATAGRRLLVGVSTSLVAQALAAARGGADYLGFGPVYPTATKEDADPVQGPSALAAVVRAVAPLPVVAIGGITVARAAEIAATGAAAACAIAAVNGAPDPTAAAAAITWAFARSTKPVA